MGYVDTVEEITLTTGSVNGLADTLWIGATDTDDYVGKIDEVAIFSDVLTPAEIEEIYLYGLK